MPAYQFDVDINGGLWAGIRINTDYDTDSMFQLNPDEFSFEDQASQAHTLQISNRAIDFTRVNPSGNNAFIWHVLLITTAATVPLLIRANGGGMHIVTTAGAIDVGDTGEQWVERNFAVHQ